MWCPTTCCYHYRYNLLQVCTFNMMNGLDSLGGDIYLSNNKLPRISLSVSLKGEISASS